MKVNEPIATTMSTDSALFVGDAHGDAGWFKFVVLPTVVRMGINTIIQVGDFGIASDSERPNSWILEMASCDEHRERMREVLESVTPSVLIHGHAAYERAHVESWGSLKTYGLDRNTHMGWGVVMREVDGESSFRWVDDDSQ
jgi:hypothetical protein